MLNLWALRFYFSFKTNKFLAPVGLQSSRGDQQVSRHHMERKRQVYSDLI